MDIVMRKVSELTPYDKNAKVHDAKQIANVAQSIKEMGWKQPLVVDANGVVIVGHCRLLAAKKLKQKEVPCVVADDLTDEQIRKYRILDNKLAESPWELDLLAEDMADLSFDGYEIDFPGLDAEEFATDEDDVTLWQSNLSAYQHVHYLVTIDINDHDRFVPLIDNLRQMEAEVKETRNNT